MGLNLNQFLKGNLIVRQHTFPIDPGPSMYNVVYIYVYNVICTWGLVFNGFKKKKEEIYLSYIHVHVY